MREFCILLMVFLWGTALCASKPVAVAIYDHPVSIIHKDIRQAIRWSDPAIKQLKYANNGHRNPRVISEYYNHGTSVAGIIINQSPGAKIVPLFYAPTICWGIDLCKAGMKTDAQIINLSMGAKPELVHMGLSYLSYEFEALTDLCRAGKLVVKSMGNYGDGNYQYVKDLVYLAWSIKNDSDIAGALILTLNSHKDKLGNDVLAQSSGRLHAIGQDGMWLPDYLQTAYRDCVVCAPGTDIATYDHIGNSILMTGTSASAPFVSALAANIMMQTGVTNPKLVASAILNSCSDPILPAHSDLGFIEYMTFSFGRGIANPAESLRLAGCYSDWVSFV